MAKLPQDLALLLGDLRLGRREVTVAGASRQALPYIVARLQRALKRLVVVLVESADRGRAVTEAINAYLAPDGELSAAIFYPDVDVSPYAGLSPGRGLGIERLAALFRVSQGIPPQVLVAPIEALSLYTLPRARLARAADIVVEGETLDRESFLSGLVAGGYQSVPVVEDSGTFAARGGIIDVFSPMYDLPARIELWGDDVDTIRTFDPDTQRSMASLGELYVCPAREVLLDEAAVERGLVDLRRLCDDAELPTSRMRTLMDDLRNGILGVGMEFLLPAFYPEPETLYDYLPRDTVFVLEDPEPLGTTLVQSFARLATQYEMPRTRELLVYPPERYVRPPQTALRQLRERTRLAVRSVVVEENLSGPLHELRLSTHDELTRDLGHAPGGERSLKPLAEHIRAWQSGGATCAITCHTSGQATRLREMLNFYGLRVRDHDAPPRLDALDGVRDEPRSVHLFRAALSAGFHHPEAGLVVIDEEEIFGKKRRRRGRPRVARDLVPSLQELVPGDYVVHMEHGIGRFERLEKLTVSGSVSDFLRITYRGGTTLLLPVQALDRVQRYVGAGEAAPGLDRLGGTAWQKRKGRVKKAVREMASGLLKLYASRQALPGHACLPPDEAFREFEATFPYDETADQLKAIDEVLGDMTATRPMDRLVCGDVGFGKTEVAMRAAFLAVAGGKQVIVLVPTTVLAEQHRLSFTERLGPHGVLVDALSRFKTAKEQREVVQRLKDGKLDVVIGTHRLLSKDIEIPNLGLLVIDEEHRFGVAHKERLKELRAQVDVLTMTATPIPRTLNMALSGMRDLSIIATPPQDRLAVRTMVTRGTDDMIRDGIRRELARGGQVFFIHNRVQSIAGKAEFIQKIVPEARIAVAHGQMDERSLEKIMLAFIEGEVNVLVSTAIVESGLDIPNANTMFIDRADRFGLAQLYQLRGRIGRSRERAWAYLLIPNPAGLEGDARKRISVLQRFSDLGSGFNIATYDLEIRGAGNLLGAEQSGQVGAVGYELFIRMLEEAIQEMRGEQAAAIVETELKLELPAYLPEEWLPDPQERVRVYRRLAAAEDSDALDALAEELEDRFGAAPAAVRNLIESLRVKRLAGRLGIREVVYGPGSIIFALSEEGPFTPESLVALVNRRGNRFRLTADTKLMRALTKKEWDAGIVTVLEALKELRGYLDSVAE